MLQSEKDTILEALRELRTGYENRVGGLVDELTRVVNHEAPHEEIVQIAKRVAWSQTRIDEIDRTIFLANRFPTEG